MRGGVLSGKVGDIVVYLVGTCDDDTSVDAAGSDIRYPIQDSSTLYSFDRILNCIPFINSFLLFPPTHIF